MSRISRNKLSSRRTNKLILVLGVRWSVVLVKLRSSLNILPHDYNYNFPFQNITNLQNENLGLRRDDVNVCPTTVTHELSTTVTSNFVSKVVTWVTTNVLTGTTVTTTTATVTVASEVTTNVLISTKRRSGENVRQPLPIQGTISKTGTLRVCVWPITTWNYKMEVLRPPFYYNMN